MISRSKYLVWLFAGLFLLLLGIQVYFMYKTYQVKKREIYTSVLSKITKHIDDLEDLGELDEQAQKIFLRNTLIKKSVKKNFLIILQKTEIKPEINSAITLTVNLKKKDIMLLQELFIYPLFQFQTVQS